MEEAKKYISDDVVENKNIKKLENSNLESSLGWQNKKTKIEEIKKNEGKEKMNYYFDRLKSSASKVQMEIENTWEINHEARKERWKITVEQTGDDFLIGSYGVRTKINFIDYDKISIFWWGWHNLEVDLDVIGWMDQIIKISNIINMVMRTTEWWDLMSVWTTVSLEPAEIKGFLKDPIKEFRSGFWWFDVVKKSTLEDLSVDPDLFVTYINTRKYAEK